MNPDMKTFHSIWIPIRTLKEIEDKKPEKLSRNNFMVLLIQEALNDEEIIKSVAKQGSKPSKQKSQAVATEVLNNTTVLLTKKDGDDAA